MSDMRNAAILGYADELNKPGSRLRLFELEAHLLDEV